MILAIDPGKNNGYAEFEDDGTFIFMGQLMIDDMLEFLNKYDKPVSTVVVEDYVLFKKRALAQSGSKMEAAQVIGAAKSFAMRKKAKFVRQRSDVLPIAQKISGMKLPTDHNISHQFSAYNHGYYWMVQQGLRKPMLVERTEAEKANG